MAFNEFYVITTGSDVNSGSTTSNTASVTSTNGDWGSVTANRFTPNGGGTPFSTVSVGDWASIYLDAAVLAVYIAQVTAVNGGGATLDFSTTAKYGTAPTTGATGRTVKIGGAWATPNAFINTGTTAVYTSTRINVKAGTYANTTTARTFNNAGSATAILWWRGYNATIGDLDTDYTTAKPAITFTTAALSISGAKQLFSNLYFTGARTAGAQTTIANECHFKRCRFENTGVNALASAVSFATVAGEISADCYFKATSTATRVVQVAVAVGFKKCTFDGGGIGLDTANAMNFFSHNVFINNTSHGINATTAAFRYLILFCTFKACGGDGIHMTAAPTSTGGIISGNLFDSCTGWGINNASGTNADVVVFEDNDFYNNTLGTITGFGDKPDFNEITESSSPVVSSTDLTLVSGANGASMLRPFENESFTGGYYDAGAVQRQVTTGGGPVEHSHLFVGP